MENTSEQKTEGTDTIETKKRQSCSPCSCRRRENYAGGEYSLSYRQYPQNGKGGPQRALFWTQIPWERARGITIFSKQAGFSLGEKNFTLLDTPGHVDFSAEMERTLQVLDYAVLLISGADGIQGHVQTLWRLLKQYKIPVFLFINKMDQEGTDRRVLLLELQKKLDERCVDFGGDRKREEVLEEIAMCEESVLEHYLEEGEISTPVIQSLIAERRLFPCYFGSALKSFGIKEFLEGMETYIQCPKYSADFGARIFKISRDDKGNRLTYMKITGER